MINIKKGILYLYNTAAKILKVQNRQWIKNSFLSKNVSKVSIVGNLSRGWPESSLFNSYYT